ncbi:MAG: siroheme synthase, partial [Firmicutes bacterium]|nr:siroheme synthase [Bacillota bacterium]
PALSRQLRAELADTYGTEYELYLELVANVRSFIKTKVKSSREREIFWNKAMNKEILDLLKQGELSVAEEKIKHAISSCGTQS